MENQDIPLLEDSAPPEASTVLVAPIVHLWILRILQLLGGHRKFVHSYGFSDDEVAEAIGMASWLEEGSAHSPKDLRNIIKRTKARSGESPDFDTAGARAHLRATYQVLEEQAAELTLPDCLQHNMTQLAELAGLTDVDRQILAFAVLVHNESALNDAVGLLGSLTSTKALHAISVILQLPEPEVRAALGIQSILSRSGLLALDRSCASGLLPKLRLLCDVFADLMTAAVIEPVSLLRGTVSAAAPGHLQLCDYTHIQPSLDILLPYLRQATKSRKSGVNIFLHGAPGTGKSQLVRTLAKELQSELFEVACEDEDGDALKGERRLRSYRAAQSFFAHRQALMVFDEVEDVFSCSDEGFPRGADSTAQVRKGWINRMLEENPMPTFWLSNSMRGLDPAFVRRFDMVIELPVPPRSQREKILKDSAADLLEPYRLARLAEAEVLAPAIIAKAGSVVRAIQQDLEPGKVGESFERLISSTIEAQGHSPLSSNDMHRLPEIYDPGFIHADVDLASVANGLQSVGSGRLCLYGPSGTGKTAYGRWLAQQLGVPLHVKRASDLMSMWVGGNEKNIARAFRNAQDDGAVLLMDEVDSFLQDRRGVRSGWEVNLVNEMLTQMESFSGVFIASTNLMDNLDQAALRRFDLKVKFDFLRAEQARALLLRHCAALGLQTPRSDALERLDRLQQLTPGDFAVVLRQHRFRPFDSADMLVSALDAECAVKESAKRSIGFR